MRKEPLVTGEYYHIYNRGVDKRDIFLNIQNLGRFKESIKQFNQIEGIGSLELYHKSVRALGSHNLPNLKLKPDPLVLIVAFCINPNHFHFILKQIVDGGIAKFMQKILGGYTYYFNQKNERSGSLFQGTFKSKLIVGDDCLRKTFAYVNNNYLIHNIPKNKSHFIFSSNEEYEREIFDFVSTREGKEMLEIFGGKKVLQKDCQEIISIIRQERDEDFLLDLEK